MADAIKQKVSIWILLTLVIPPLMVGVDLMIMGVAIEPLAVSLGVSISLLQWLLAGYAIGNASFYVIAGKLADMFGAKKIVNIGLLVFNLLPVPPLDGSRVVVGLLPPEMAAAWNRLEPYGFLILLVLFYTGILSKVIMPLISFSQSLLLP